MNLVNEAADVFSRRWSVLKLENNEPMMWNVDTFCIYVQRLRNDLMIAHSKELLFPASPGVLEKINYLPIGLDWKRWALDEGSDQIRFWPTLPDKPLVVKTRTPMIIPPESSIELYINLPIWIDIAVAHKGGFMTLEKYSSSRLSNTWFGDHFEGELCYALKSRARRAVEDLTDETMRCVCKFTIRNRSEEPLPVEKVRALPEHLGFYRVEGRLWSNSIHVDFLGKNEPSRVSYENSSPFPEKQSEVLREAPNPFKSGSLLDSHVFKSLFH